MILLRSTMICSLLFVGCLEAFPAGAQVPGQPRGWIEIQEPAAWRGEGTRGFVAQPRSSIRVVGQASHPAGVARVLINGERAAIETDAMTGSTRFVGYVAVTDDTREVEVAVYPRQDRPFTQMYRVTPTGIVPAAAGAGDPWARTGARFRGERWAVIVGVSEHQDPRITPLRFADADALAFRDFLLSERAGLGGFKPENVVLLLNEEATYRNIRTALFDFLKAATRDDIVMIYFAGHGTPDPERLSDFYLVTHDTDVDRLAGTAFPMEDVTSAVRRTLARDILVITDACHSAGVGGQLAFRDLSLNQINRVFLDQLESSTGGLAILTASEANQLSQEGERWGGGHGVFTYYLLRGLEGEADEDQDGIVTLGELYEYVRQRVSRETRNAQVPSMGQTAWDRAWPVAAVVAPPPAPAPAVAAAPQFTPQPVRPPTEPVRVDPAPVEATPPAADATRPIAAPPPAEPEAAAQARADAAPAVPAAGLSAGQAAALSLVVPGLGQLSTGRPSGALYLGLAGGAVAAGFLVTETTVRCGSAAQGGVCPEGDVLDREVHRPYLLPGIGGAVAVGVVSAIAAYRGVSGAAASGDRGSRQGASDRPPGSGLAWQPPAIHASAEAIHLELVRLRF